MRKIVIRNAVGSDFPRIIQMNDAEVKQTSPMDIVKLRQLDDLSAFHRIVLYNEEIAGFIIAMQHDADYVNDNYLWFASRYQRFIYIDRIVIGKNYSKKGLGSVLYDNLFMFAKDNEIPTITCEYNIQPPNDASKKFHTKYGFTEVGRQHVDNHSKLVSLQMVEI